MANANFSYFTVNFFSANDNSVRNTLKAIYFAQNWKCNNQMDKQTLKPQ